MTTWVEGQDGADRRYREWLLPPWWLWVVSLGFVAALAVAYGAALGTTAGVIAGAVSGLTVIGLLIVGSPVVHVDDRVLRAGRARLPLRYVGRVRVLDAERTRAITGPDGDPEAFVLLRQLTTPTTVAVEVLDPRDPHPYWLISSAHPQRLADSLAHVAGPKEHP